MPPSSPPRFSRRELLGALGGALVLPARATDAYPSRPIRLVVPFTAGGGADLVARSLGEGLNRDLGQSIVIDNKPGGGTVIGADAVAKAAGDGYTLLMSTSALAVNTTLVRKLPYDTDRDLAGVARVCTGPNVLVTRTDRPYRTVADVIAAAQARPGRLTFGSSGNGTAVHLAGELFKSMAHVDLTHVPYRGAGPGMSDLLGGQIDFLFITSGAVGRFVEAGQVRAIAITSAQPSPAFKGVPTIAQTVPGYEAEVWYAVFGPAGMPAEVVARLNVSIRKAAATPGFRQRVEPEGLNVAVNSPAEMNEFMRSEEARWRKVIVEANIAGE